MRALDTNIVLRLMLNDDPAQVATARRLMGQPAHVGTGVLMEAGWVMASSYRLSRAAIAAALHGFLDIPTAHVTDEPGVRWAIDRYRDHGADLADMLHIVAARGSSSFASFDEHLGRQVGERSPVPVETLT